jgi:hypothetical protein
MNAFNLAFSVKKISTAKCALVVKNLCGANSFCLHFFRYKGWLAGYQLAIDTAKTAKTRLTQSNFAVGYTKDDLTLHTAV